MNPKLTLILLSLIVIALGTSCTTHRSVTNGANDSRPLLFNNEYKSVDVLPVEDNCKAICGIPLSTKIEKEYRTSGGKGNPRAFAVYLNGVQLNSHGRLLPTISLLGLTFGIGYGLHTAAGFKKLEATGGSYSGGVFQPNTESITKARLPLGWGFALALPISGAMNNMLFRNAAASRAYRWSNYQLLYSSKGADLFYYPKLEWTTEYKGLWIQKASFKLRAKASVLKTQD